MTESTAADVQTEIPLLQPCCQDLGQHYLVYPEWEQPGLGEAMSEYHGGAA